MKKKGETLTTVSTVGLKVRKISNNTHAEKQKQRRGGEETIFIF